MPRIRVALAILVTGLAFSAVAVTGSASAAWVIAGTELPEGSKAPLASTAKVATATIISVPAIKTKVACTSSLLRGESPEIVGGIGEIKAKSLTFGSCATTEPATGCKLEHENANISTQPVVGYMVEGSTSSIVNVRLMPQTKTTIASIAFSEANTCAFTGEEPLKGKVTLRAPTGQKEEKEQAVEGLGSTENNSLELGAGNKAYIEGAKVELKLTSEKAFAFPLPAVVPAPTEWKAGEFKVGAANPPKKTIVFTNNGPGAWTGLLGATYIVLRGAAADQPFKPSAGTVPCNKRLAVTDTCEMVVEFNPPKAEEYLGILIQEPFARPVTVEGKGIP